MLDPASLILLALGAGILPALCCLLVRLLPSEGAAARHLLWTLTLLGVLALPLLHWALPSGIQLPMQPTAQTVPGPATAAEPGPAAALLTASVPTGLGPADTHTWPVQPGVRALAEIPAEPAELRAAPGSPGRPIAIESLRRSLGPLAALWTLGALLMAFSLWRSHRAAGQLAAAGRIAPKAWIEEASRVARQLKLRRLPEVYTVAGLEVPVVVGLVHPKILLPKKAVAWPPPRRLAVLLHEMAHLRRFDLWSGLVGELARTVYWFHPLVWLAVGRQHDEAERACDRLVLSAGVLPRSYAGDLLAIASQAQVPRFGAALAFGRQQRLRARLESILDFRLGPASPRWPAVLATLTLCIALGLLGLLRPHSSSRALAQTVAEEESPSQPNMKLLAALQDLRTGDSTERLHAAWNLGQMENPRAVPGLHRALHNTDGEVRGMAAWALGEIKDSRSVPVLVHALEDTDALALEMVVKALGELEDPSAAGPLAALMADETAWAELRLSVVWSLGEIARRAAQEHGSGLSQALAALETAAKADSDSQVRAAAVRGVPPGLGPSVLQAALTDSEASVRRAVAVQLGSVRADGPLATEARQVLLRILDDSSSEVRRAAAIGLGRLRSAESADALIARLRDHDPGVRDAATWALDELQGE